MESIDPAAVFASAYSLWQACTARASDVRLNLSDAYNGMDQFMREVMRVANCFEAWACKHVDFNETDSVWPYLLQDEFGSACLKTMAADELADFDEGTCLRIAMQLELPLKYDECLRIPVCVAAANPVSGSAFGAFRIQSLRASQVDGAIVPYRVGDDPFDEEFGPPYFGIYGEGRDGLLEHIADRRTFADAAGLVRKLVPGVIILDRPPSLG